MSFRRKKHDGNISGGNTSTAKRRNPVGTKDEINQYAPSERTGRNLRYLVDNELDTYDDSDAGRYLITYADLITLLLCLFIILYAISNVDLVKYQKMMGALGNIFGNQGEVMSISAPEINVIVTPIDQLKLELSNLIKDNNYMGSVSIENNERGFTIRILDDILFTSGESELNNEAKNVLGLVSNLIKDLPNDIRIEGHTDNVKIVSAKYPSNWHLSIDRAMNTAYYLIQSENINPDRVSVVGYSEYQQIAENNTAEGRAKNRRVDIVVINK